MLRVTTLYASSAATTAGYYTQYLAQAEGEAPGVWSGAQSSALGLGGEVGAELLQAVLEGRDPVAGTPLGMRLVDRYRADGSVVRAVAGFDATFSAPKSVSVLWALSGDERILAVHDQAVAVALAHLERFGSTTRKRVDGGRVFLETNGLTMATFRQSTSRADDPQLHTHAVISAKVQTPDGGWWALDARYLKRHQRMLGGLYQSAMRAGLQYELGITWGPVRNGQAEIAGVPTELLAALSKRTVEVQDALRDKVRDFHDREGRDPTAWERAAMTREAAVDTRSRKTGKGAGTLMEQWRDEAGALGWDARSVWSSVRSAAEQDHTLPPRVTVGAILDDLSARGSTWSRADIVRTVCDRVPAQSMNAERWASVVERGVDRVVADLVDLDPPASGAARVGDGRSVWIEPTAARFTSDHILAEEEHVLTWAVDRQTDDPSPSDTVTADGLDVMQADAARAVAGRDRLVLVEGPAGTGKTTMLAAAVTDLEGQGRAVFGVAPTAKAAQVLGTETGMRTDTLAKLLHEHTRPDRAPQPAWTLPRGTTLVVDEAGMIGTSSLHALARLADRHDWRVVLVGDPRQLQAVGRGGMFAELTATGRVHELAAVHRFRHGWEAEASLALRRADVAALDAYEQHGRIVPGTVEYQTTRIATSWTHHSAAGRSVAVTASTNEHVDALNAAIQSERLKRGQLADRSSIPIAGGERAHVGEIVVTRRNDRTLTTTTGDTVRNRDRWTVTATHTDGSITVTPIQGHGTVRLPVDYVREHVRLGYAATEHGNQGVTTDVAHHLVTPATTARGLYVGATRGRDRNDLHVITDTFDASEARRVLEGVLAIDRADTPAVVHRRLLRAVEPPAPATRIPEPAWLAGWRQDIHQQWEALVQARQERQEAATAAATALQELKPALDAARAAWEPHRKELADLHDTLRADLEPALRTARKEAERARLGQHRRAGRALDAAEHAVGEMHARIEDAVQLAAPTRERYEQVARRAERLAEQAEPDGLVEAIEDMQRRPLERLISAIDTWRDWNGQRPVETDDLVAALQQLGAATTDAPTADRTRPLSAWLQHQGVDLTPRRQLELDAGIDL